MEALLSHPPEAAASRHQDPPAERHRAACRDVGARADEIDPSAHRLARRAAAFSAEEITAAVTARLALDSLSEVLVERAHAGDTRAVSRLVDLWQHHVLRWCRFHCTAGDVAEDAAHDVLIAVLTTVRGLRDPTVFRAWLWGVTWRTTRARGRKPWFSRWVFGLSEDRADQHDLEALVVAGERDRATALLLGELPTEDRELLWLHYGEGLSRREICAIKDMPEGTLNRKLTAARRSFEKRARRRGLMPGEGT